MRNFLVLHNPMKPAIRVLDKVGLYLRKLDLPFKYCTDLGDESLNAFSDLIIIGGDGTINYAINHLSSFDLPIGIIPAGSGNDYVKSLNIGNTLEERIRTAVEGQAAEVDLGQCNDRLFINGLGLGFDGEIAKSFEENRTILRGHAAYYYHVVRVLASFRPQPLKFSVDGKEFDDKVLLLTIGKGTTCGGGFKLTPHANIKDGQFAISIIHNLKPFKRFLNIHRLQQGSHDRLEEVEFLKGRHIMVEPQPNLTAHIDGELIGSPPFEVRILPKKLRIKISQI